MSELSHREQLKSAYSHTKVSDSYINERFDSAVGRILHEAQINFVIEAITQLKITNVLEIAPGPARLTVDIGLACSQTSGKIIDINENMLDQAHKRLNVAGLADRWETVVGDAFDLPFEMAFELIYTFRFIRHFHEDSRAKIYGQIYDHLKPGGYLILDAINHDVSAPLRAKSGLGAYPIYDELYRFPQLQEELVKNRFKIVKHIAVQHSFPLLNLIQIWIAPRSQKVAYQLMKMVEASRIGLPLEWILLCQKV